MTRTFTNTLLFETVLDSVPGSNILLTNIIQSFFHPNVLVIESDCSTLLGNFQPLSYKVLGSVELSTGLPINNARLMTLITTNVTEVAERSLSTCISNGGICQACYSASRPNLVLPSIGSRVTIDPEMIIDVQQISFSAGQTSMVLPYNSDQYSYPYLFLDGALVSSSSYTITDSTLTLVTPPVSSTTFVIKFAVITNSLFFYWLAETFSGSLLGIEPFGKILLPIRKATFLPLIPTEDIKSIINILQNSTVSQEDSVQYISNISDPLEQAVLTIMLAALFLN
jgi:hypothetical protein